MRSVLIAAFGLVLTLSTTAPVQACTACFGQSDSDLARGMNMGIFVLLFVITSVLCAVAGFFVFVAHRTAQLEQAAQLGEQISQHQSNA